jgi:hypothetical protein
MNGKLTIRCEFNMCSVSAPHPPERQCQAQVLLLVLEREGGRVGALRDGGSLHREHRVGHGAQAQHLQQVALRARMRYVMRWVIYNLC